MNNEPKGVDYADEKHISQTESEMSLLELRIVELDSLLEKLDEKLIPVKLPLPETEGETKEIVESMCPLATGIRECRSRIERMISFTSRLSDEIQL